MYADERSAPISQVIVVRPGDVLVFSDFPGDVNGEYLSTLREDARLARVAAFAHGVTIHEALAWYLRDEAAKALAQ